MFLREILLRKPTSLLVHDKMMEHSLCKAIHSIKLEDFNQSEQKLFSESESSERIFRMALRKLKENIDETMVNISQNSSSSNSSMEYLRSNIAISKKFIFVFFEQSYDFSITLDDWLATEDCYVTDFTIINNVIICVGIHLQLNEDIHIAFTVSKQHQLLKL